jgi:RNA polymerase sporulation-specific sigma factor
LEINDNVEQEDERRILYDCMDDLSDRERLIMNMRFGMCGEKEHTQKEVADELGISQSYISRLEKRILLKLKRDIERLTMEK